MTCILMIFFWVSMSPFGAGMPNPGERLGFNLVYDKCSPQNYKRGGGSRWVKSQVSGSCPKYPPPSYQRSLVGAASYRREPPFPELAPRVADHTHASHAWEMGHNTCTMNIKGEGVGGT